MKLFLIAIFVILGHLSLGRCGELEDFKLVSEKYIQSLRNLKYEYRITNESNDFEEKVKFLKIDSMFRYDIQVVVNGKEDEPIRRLVCYDGGVISSLDVNAGVLTVGSLDSWREFETLLRRLILTNPALSSYAVVSRRGGFSHLSHLSPDDFGLSKLFESEVIEFRPEGTRVRMVSKAGIDMGSALLDPRSLLPLKILDESDLEDFYSWKAKEYLTVSDNERNVVTIPTGIEMPYLFDDQKLLIEVDATTLEFVDPRNYSKEDFLIPSILANEVIDLDHGGYGTVKAPN